MILRKTFWEKAEKNDVKDITIATIKNEKNYKRITVSQLVKIHNPKVEVFAFNRLGFSFEKKG